jgi:hypothetical protein
LLTSQCFGHISSPCGSIAWSSQAWELEENSRPSFGLNSLLMIANFLILTFESVDLHGFNFY